MKQYLNLLDKVLTEGEDRKDRTSIGTKSIFGYQMHIDLNDGFPLLTTKKMHLKSIIYELLWFLKGDTNTKYLNKHKVKIWNEWADKNGDLGPIYGHQWRKWKKNDGTCIDQISTLVERIKTNPYSRRHIISTWNVGDLSRMALPPCHVLFQFYISPSKSNNQNPILSCQLYQRSADIFLGVPFNIASYALLTMMVAQVCNLEVGKFIHTFGDAHIYSNHIEQAKTQLMRNPLKKPVMKLNPNIRNIFNFTFEDFTLSDYNAYPHIKAPIAI